MTTDTQFQVTLLINTIGRHLSASAPTNTEYSATMVDTLADMPRAYFDMILANGTVFRIRVSDITPERVTP